MATGKFRLNRGTVRRAATTDAGIIAKLHDAGERIAAGAGPNAELEDYVTDRAVVGVSVPSIDQARDGALTRGVGAAGGNIS